MHPRLPKRLRLSGQTGASQSSSQAETLRGDQEMMKIVALTLLFVANAVLVIIDRRGRESLEKRLMEPDKEDR